MTGARTADQSRPDWPREHRLTPAVTFVAAMTAERVIGKDNALPWSLPADLAHFRRLTLGKPVIMGRRVWDSIGRPLPGRHNIVLSRDPDFRAFGADVAHSPDDALSRIAEPEAMVIGGEQVYRAYLQRVTCAHLTLIDASIPGDTVFPHLPGRWEETARAERRADALNRADLSFVTLVRVS